MKSKLLTSSAAERRYVVVFDTGEEVAAALLEFARTESWTAAHFTGIGAFSGVVLGFFDVDKKDYDRIDVSEQVEVLSLVGNVALFDGEPRIHAHIVLGKRDGTALGGHLIEGHVRPTLELVIEEMPEELRRVIDGGTGLPLIEL